MWGSILVPKAYAKSYKSTKQNPEFDFNLKLAMSLARCVQDPLAETLNQWSEINLGNL